MSAIYAHVACPSSRTRPFDPLCVFQVSDDAGPAEALVGRRSDLERWPIGQCLLDEIDSLVATLSRGAVRF